MSIDRAEAVRLARICLPKIVGGDGGGGAVEDLSEKDVTVQSLCRLWAGMGYIYQISATLPTTKMKRSFIVKRVVPPSKRARSFGDERKAVSYAVEANFYEHLAPNLLDAHGLAIPTPYHVERDEETDEITICMSRLSGSPGYLDDGKARAVLGWLATLHAATWGTKVDGCVDRGWVQPIGSYWHLDTRPDEHASMPRGGCWEGRLKMAARAIDERLKRDEMQCCIHGDAKDANMLFEEGVVKMYDFQYCGKAPPSVDLAYFLCVAVGDTDSEYLRFYHEQLVKRLDKNIHRPTIQELEDSVALALCDFQRFMSGWGQWGSDISSAVVEVLDRLDGGTKLASEEAYREAVRREYG